MTKFLKDAYVGTESVTPSFLCGLREDTSLSSELADSDLALSPQDSDSADNSPCGNHCFSLPRQDPSSWSPVTEKLLLHSRLFSFFLRLQVSIAMIISYPHHVYFQLPPGLDYPWFEVVWFITCNTDGVTEILTTFGWRLLMSEMKLFTNFFQMKFNLRKYLKPLCFWLQ